jgi:hypothetical protein
MKDFKTKKVIICCLLILSTSQISAQSDNFKSDRTELAIFNIGVNALFGGIGSLINKKDNDTNFKTFANGFYKGAIGGTVSHVGLSMSHLIESKQNISYAWPARLVNAMGNSIVQNAAENNKMFERLHFNLYVARLEYFPYRKKFNARFFTSSLYGIVSVGNGSRFDLGKSLQSGILYFEFDGRFQSSFGFSGTGTGQVSSIGMSSDLFGEQFYRIYAEEVAHIQQYDRKVAGNAFVAKLDRKWKEKSKSYNTLSKYIYLDLNGPTFYFAYLIGNRNGYCNNFFEKEAVNYSNRRVGPCN